MVLSGSTWYSLRLWRVFRALWHGNAEAGRKTPGIWMVFSSRCPDLLFCFAHCLRVSIGPWLISPYVSVFMLLIRVCSETSTLLLLQELCKGCSSSRLRAKSLLTRIFSHSLLPSMPMALFEAISWVSYISIHFSFIQPVTAHWIITAWCILRSQL